MGALMNTTTRRVTTLVTGMALAAGAGLAIGHATTATAEPEVRTVTKTATVTLRDTSEIDRLTKNLHGQYDVNAQYADTIADLRAKLADATKRADAEPKVVTKQVTKQVTKRVPDPATERALADMTEKRDQAVAIADDLAADIEDLKAHGVETWYEDGSYVTYDGTGGCAPTAMCDD